MSWAAANWQGTLDKANEYANLENYPQAITLYEQLVKDHPSETKLKSNLSVLYFNHAVQLQNNQQFSEAETLLLKAKALTPNEPSIKKALGANYYYQTMALKNADSTDYHQMRALAHQAIDYAPDEAAFKTALAVIIHKEGLNVLQTEPVDYPKATELLNEALTLEPGHPTLRHSLAQAYLTWANQTEDQTQKQQYVDKALSLEDSPTLQLQAKQVLSGQVTFKEAQTARNEGITGSNDSATSAMPAAQKLAAIEKALSLPIDEALPLLTRLEKAEDSIYGKKQKGGVTERVDNAYYALLGTGQTYKNSVPNLVQASVTTTEGTYLDRVFEYTDGRVVRWARFPVRVYIEEPELKESKLYKAEYLETVKAALASWKTATNGFVSYTIVKNPMAADIEITFNDETYDNRYAKAEHIANNKLQTYTPPVSSKVAQAVQVAGMFAPGFFSLAPQAVAAGIQYREQMKLQTIIDESKIALGLGSLQGLAEDQASTFLTNMTAQAFGHALGIKGSSDNVTDLMYPQLKADEITLPSSQDVKTLINLYQRPANIVLNIR